MTIKHLWPVLAALATAAMMSACGGGGGGIAGTGCSANANASCDGVAMGTITGFGSVVVNGRHYETTDANITVNGQSGAPQSALREGMQLRMTYRSDQVTDDRVTAVGQILADQAISGHVTGGALDSFYLVMGQELRIDPSTALYLDGVKVASLPLTIEDFVQAHGQLDENDQFVATYIEKLSTPRTEFELKGRASGHNPATKEVSIGILRVNYAGATPTGLPSGSWNDLVLEAKGTCTGPDPRRACGTLNATRLSAEGSVAPSAGLGSVQATVEGNVRSGTSASFSLKDLTVTTAGARWAGGSEADFVVGGKVQVDGTLSGSTLTASKVSLRDAVRLEADVSAVDNSVAGVRTYAFAGLPGVTAYTNGYTLDANGNLLNSTNAPAVGDHVRMRARLTGDGLTAVISRVETRGGASARLELRGPVRSAAGSTLVVLGRAISLDAAATYTDSRGTTDLAIDRAAFLAAAKVGATVKLRSNDRGATWSEAELEAD